MSSRGTEEECVVVGRGRKEDMSINGDPPQQHGEGREGRGRNLVALGGEGLGTGGIGIQHTMVVMPINCQYFWKSHQFN